MPKNSNKTLHTAKKNKQNEYYTRYKDIEKEINAYISFNPYLFKNATVLCPCDTKQSNFTQYFIKNFEALGLKKLISTSYNPNGKGKIFIKEKDFEKEADLLGNGDFKSEEITKLREQTDFIITNPPFSLFRDFFNWIRETENPFLQFSIIGALTAIGYKNIFPLLAEGVIWLGKNRNGMGFIQPNNNIKRIGGSVWFSCIPYIDDTYLDLKTFSENIKKSKYVSEGYKRYENYNAIDIPYTNLIPSDYKGIMGVPISFFSKYNPTQFKIVGFRKGTDGKDLYYLNEDKTKHYPFTRILIRHN